MTQQRAAEHAPRPRRPRPISGFPEWLPETRSVELAWLRHIEDTFERYGYTSIETPSVEELEVLQAKGETDKEMYTLTRLQNDPDERDRRLGLHYDLTVPFARYVAQHFNDLDFPFRRYQIQRVWRGERPQEGRYREFIQCDIDVIDIDDLSLHVDAEMPATVHEILSGRGVGAFTLHISNRKLLEGFYEGLGIEDVVAAVRITDKLDKIGPDGVSSSLVAQLGIDPRVAKRCLDLAAIRTPDVSFADAVTALGVETSTLREGLQELTVVMELVAHLPRGDVLADLSIARGFDYYTGSIYEGRLAEYPSLGSICSGGRYDDLASSFIRRRLPGVGISIGLTRLFGKLVAEGRIAPGSKTPATVMVAVVDDAARPAAVAAGHALRKHGLCVDVFVGRQRLRNQLRYASRKGIRYVWFPAADPAEPHQVKDLESGEQWPADLASWAPGVYREFVRKPR